MRISQKIFFSLTGIVVFTLTSILFVLYLKSEHELKKLSATYGQNLVEQVAQFAAEPVFAQDLLSLNALVSQLESAEYIGYAAIVNSQFKPLAEIGEKPSQDADGLYQAPIRFQASHAGYAIVTLDQSRISGAFSTTRYMLFVVIAAILGVSLLIVSGITQHIVGGIRATTRAFHALAAGHLDTRLKIQRHDEMGELIQSFNELGQGLLERHQLMNPLATKVMAERRNNSLTNGHIHITQMFVDLSEINRHIDKLSADSCTQLLNVYNQVINLAARHYDCDYCRFDREGIAIRFLASDPQEAANACLDAICASQLALRLIDRLNQSRFERHLPTMRISIGLHQGIGFTSHIANGQQGYTAFLSEVDNEAVRLAKLTRKGKAGISQMAVETANAAQVIQLSQYQTQPMTDFSSELRFATITGLSPQLRKPIQMQADELFQAIYPKVILHELDDEADFEESDDEYHTGYTHSV